ncbi:hypothetical protein C1645_780505, partial [Glomus cerebriforme]
TSFFLSHITDGTVFKKTRNHGIKIVHHAGSHLSAFQLIFWYIQSYLSQEVRCHKNRENSLCTYYWNISPMIVLFTVLATLVSDCFHL